MTASLCHSNDREQRASVPGRVIFTIPFAFRSEYSTPSRDPEQTDDMS